MGGGDCKITSLPPPGGQSPAGWPRTAMWLLWLTSATWLLWLSVAVDRRTIPNSHNSRRQPPTATGPSDQPRGCWQWLLVADASAIRLLWLSVAVAQQPPTATKPWLLSVAVAQQPRGCCDSHNSHVAVVAVGRRTPTATWLFYVAVDPWLLVAVAWLLWLLSQQPRGCRAWLSVAVDA